MELGDSFSDTASCSSKLEAKEVKVVVVLTAMLVLSKFLKSFVFYEVKHILWEI